MLPTEHAEPAGAAESITAVGVLPALLSEMFAVSAAQGAQVHRKLASGLHLRVGVRGARRMIIVWRDGERLPSAKECEIVGEDAGFYDPRYRAWQTRETDSAFLIEEGYRGALCEHDWEFSFHVNARPHYEKGQRCRRCGVQVSVAYSKRKTGKTRFHYDTWELREHVWVQWLRRGPAPGTLTHLPHHGDPADESPPPTQPEPPRIPPEPQALPATVSTPETEQERQQARDRVEKARLVGLLMGVALHSAAVNLWFRHGHVIRARREYLDRADLDELREECRSRYVAWALPASLPYVRLVLGWATYGAHWRLTHRALPAPSSAPKVRRPRKKTVRSGKAVAAA